MMGNMEMCETKVLALVRKPLAEAETFDLAVATRLANEAHELHRALGRRSLAEARKCGLRLLEIKLHVGHGRFMPWVQERCHFSQESANLYMRLATAYPEDAKFVAITNLTIRQALRQAAGDEDTRKIPPPGDPRQAAIFTDAQAPMPSDPASQLLAMGVPITAKKLSVSQLRAMLSRSVLDVPATPDAQTLKEIDEAEPMLFEWLQLLRQAQRPGQRTPRLELFLRDAA